MIDEARPSTAATRTLESAPGEHCAGRLSVLRGHVRAAAGTVRYVEVSLDAGSHWDEASLTGDNAPGGAVEWEHPWTPLEAATYDLLVRVTDSEGTVDLVGPLAIDVEG